MKPCRPLCFLSCDGEYKKLSGNNSEFNFRKKTFANSAMRSMMMGISCQNPPLLLSWSQEIAQQRTDRRDETPHSGRSTENPHSSGFWYQSRDTLSIFAFVGELIRYRRQSGVPPLVLHALPVALLQWNQAGCLFSSCPFSSGANLDDKRRKDKEESHIVTLVL